MMEENQTRKQGQSSAESGNRNENGQETKGADKPEGNQGHNPRQNSQTNNARNGTKGGGKKPKSTTNPPPGSPEFAQAREKENENEENNSDEVPKRRRSGKIKRVKTVLNDEGDNIEKVQYTIPKNRYRPPKEIPLIEQERRKARDEEEKSREVILCGVPSPKSYTKESPYVTADLVMKAVDELKTRYIGNHYGINIKPTDFAFCQRQLGHVNKEFTPIIMRFRKKENAEKTLKAAEMLKILNKRGTTSFGKHREPPEEYINDKDETIKPDEEVVQNFKNRPNHFFRAPRTLEQQAADRKARAYRDSKSYKDRQKVKTFEKDQRIEQHHFERLEIPADDESAEEHDPERYGVLPEIHKPEDPKVVIKSEVAKESSTSSSDNSFQSLEGDKEDEATKMTKENKSTVRSDKINASE